jgi:hypothetical protein
MLRRGRVLALVVSLAVVGLGACSGSDDSAQLPASTAPSVPTTAPTTTTTTTPDTSAPTVPSDDDFAVTRDPFEPQG